MDLGIVPIDGAEGAMPAHWFRIPWRSIQNGHVAEVVEVMVEDREGFRGRAHPIAAVRAV